MKGLENAVGLLVFIGLVALILLQRRRLLKHHRDDRDRPVA
jgi:heme exporter protein D